MSRVSSPSIDTCLSELLREKRRLVTQTAIQQATTGGPMTATYVAQDKPQTRDVNKVQYYCFHKYGHVATQCNQKLCTHCKRKALSFPNFGGVLKLHLRRLILQPRMRLPLH
eukprot:TRINITY_DN24957_c0_g1_i3.p1 TRINITY_DN24957_c0_g1~~TRINITY_DN24957_c0_g1_i3.p1  ORF type:complete len:112 (-),score=7.33 TRINITY_DN24957_c0_g1_i3:172-507(-)